MIEIISFSQPFHKKQHKLQGNKLILFEIAKTITDMIPKLFCHHCYINNLTSRLQKEGKNRSRYGHWW